MRHFNSDLPILSLQNRMQKRFERIATALTGREKVLLAVSGGIDSMCMAGLYLDSGFEIELAHCNFHLRGEESDRDENLVSSWCSDNNIVLHKIGFDTETYAAEHSLSIEMAARELRYSWFGKICKEAGIRFVAVAHNRNDNAETMILNLLRGTGIRGLCGMKEISALPVNGFDDVRVVRPLLDFTRSEIEAYVSGKGISFCIDHTNNETIYRRNKIRHEVFPVFSDINPSFLNTFAKEMEYFAQLQSIADDFIAGVIKKSEVEKGVFLISSIMESGHTAYVLFRILEKYGFNEDAVNSLYEILMSKGTVSGKVLESPDYIVVTSSDKIFLRRKSEDVFSRNVFQKKLSLQTEISEGETSLVLEGCGIYEFNGMKFKVELLDRESITDLKQEQGTIIWDADKMPLPVLSRKWKAGDWMRPFGMRGEKKLSDIFTDMKLSLIDKEKAVVLVSYQMNKKTMENRERVAVILGMRIDDSIKVDNRTVKVYRLSILGK